MKKLDRKGLFKIISATSMVIFSLVVSFSGAIAWFNAVRNIDNSGDDFVVTGNASVTGVYIVPFLGETSGEGTDCYTFDVNNIVMAYDGNYNNAADTVKLNEYSLENPNHPILMLFEVQGTAAAIRFTTDYCFLGNNRDDFIYAKTATKADLDSLAKVADKYYEVTADETMSSKASLYYYNGSSLENRTVASYNSLPTGLGANDDGKYYRVISDNKHGNLPAIYQYNGSTGEFEMAWRDLGNRERYENNPLSSVVQFHSFTLAGSIAENTTLHTVNVEIVNNPGEENEYLSYSVRSDQSCIAIPKSNLTDSNKRSFTNFTSNERYNYHQEVVPFSGDVSGKSYIGVFVNYDSLAIEYICSNNLGHDALNAGLSFICDWKTEF